LVTANRSIPVSMFVSMTSTPGTTAPLGSVTRPLICAVVWANTDGASANSHAQSDTVATTPVLRM
jgi:hypothetical protein